MLLRKSINYPVNGTDTEMHVSFEREDGTVVIVSLDDAVLTQQLESTPLVIPNPARAELEHVIYEAAQAKVVE